MEIILFYVLTSAGSVNSGNFLNVNEMTIQAIENTATDNKTKCGRLASTL